jgi:hypothetical protein
LVCEIARKALKEKSVKHAAIRGDKLANKRLLEPDDAEIYGNTNQEIGLDMVFAETEKTKRGPRVALSDAQLQTRRDQLLQLFEGDWGRLGLELQHCQNPADLIRILSPFLNSYASQTIAIFCQLSDEIASRDDLKKTRNELRALVQRSYEVEESKRRVQEQLREIAQAKATKKKRHIIVQEQKEKRKEAWEAERNWRVISSRERDLQNQLKKQEASFGRQELFAFLKSERYELTPLSVVNAMANLPHSGWRQSMKRLAKVRSNIENGFHMQIFKAIRFLSESASKQLEKDIVSVFRAGVPLLPSRYKLARIELAKKWYFLEKAIRQSRKKTQDPTIRHFPITDLYFKNSVSANDVERIVAKHRQIAPSTRTKMSEGAQNSSRDYRFKTP